MNTFVEEMQKQLITALNRLKSHTGEIYGSLAENYPKLLSEMQGNFENAKNSSSFLLDTDRGRKKNSDIGIIINNTRNIINELDRKYSEINKQSSSILDKLNETFSYITNMSEIINSIKEDSIELELISLNAMTVAIKAGKAGGAFSYITEELKRLSSATITFTDELSLRGDSLLKRFGAFSESINRIHNSQNQLFSQFTEKLNISFEKYYSGVQKIAKTIEELSIQAESILQPLMDIMQEIQRQDIIRQSVDHVIISLENLKDNNQFETVDQLLDELSFLQNLPDLCSTLLDDIKAQIETSLDIFLNKTKEVQNKIDSLEINRKTFITEELSIYAFNTDSLHSRFSSSMKIIEELINDVETLYKSKAAIQNESRLILQEMEEMEDRFTYSNKLITRFQNINVASRIEIAKQAVLADMKETVKEMTNLTSGIEANAERALAMTRDFTEATELSIRDYYDSFKLEEKFIAFFKEEITASYSELNSSKEKIEQTINNFSVFTEKFFNLFTRSSKDLKELKILISDISDFKKKLREIKERSKIKMETNLKKIQKTEWVIHNERIQDIIKQFTILAHKKSAADLAGFKVEEGTDNGDITFF
jgi:hypothetical protein